MTSGTERQQSEVKNARRTGAFISILAVILMAAASASLFVTIQRQAKIPFAWDSAGHAWEGLIIAQDILSGDFISFIADTYRQAWWPFVHSWLLAPALIFLGKTYFAARLVSLLCFVGYACTSFLIGIEMSDGKCRYWIGLIVVATGVTSLPLLVLSAMSMTEMPALWLCSLTLLFYVKALRTASVGCLVGASLFMSATFFTQPHIGVFVIAAILLTQATGGCKILSRFNRLLFGPFLALMAAWFIDPRHITAFYGHSTFQPVFYRFWSLENWLFYPRSILFVYHSSFFAAILVILGFLYSIRRLREPAVRVFFFNALIGLALLLIKLDKRGRYIVSIVPSLWILGSLGIVEIASIVATRLQDHKKQIGIAAACGACACMLMIPGVVQTYRTYPGFLVAHDFCGDERQGKAYDFIVNNVPRESNHIAMFSSFDYYNGLKSTTMRWHLEVQRFDDQLATRQNKRMATLYIRDFLRDRDGSSFHRMIDFFHYKNVNVYEYNLLSFMKAMDSDAYQKFRSQTKLNPFSDKILHMPSINPRIGCLVIIYRDGEENINQYAREFLSNNVAWRTITTRRFNDLGVTITLYEQNRPMGKGGIGNDDELLMCPEGRAGRGVISA
jgi:hypothetical protein